MAKVNKNPRKQKPDIPDPLFPELLNLIHGSVIQTNQNANITTIFNESYLTGLFPEPAHETLESIKTQIQRTLLDYHSRGVLKSGATFQLKSPGTIRLLRLTVNQRPSGYLILAEDITDQKNFEENLRSSQRKFRILLESAAQGILVVDINGQITLANTKIEQLFGYSREELLNQPVELLIPPQYRDVHSRHRNKYILDPASRVMGKGMAISGYRKDNTQFPIEVSLSSVELHDGLYIMAFITDISERRRLENKIRRIEKLEAIGQLAGGIAHDFNNVLAGIMGLSELALRKMEPDHPSARHLNLIVQKAQDAAYLVKQLLAFSRQQAIAPRKLNLNRLIQNNYEMLQRYLGEDILLKLDLAQELWPIQADPSAIDQIITNLCINARDAMPDGGELTITTSNVDLKDQPMIEIQAPNTAFYVRISVSDTGVGIAPEVQKHIFEPFFTTKDFGHGTGLGLATVYGLVEQHHGSIQFTSRQGEGTTFHIFFPAALSLKDDDQHIPETKTSHPGTETILLVDDEEAILNSHKELLESLGYRVFTATDGLVAYQLLEKHVNEIELVISDVVMPNLGGIDLKILAERLNPDIRFLLISAYSDKLDPGIPYLQKPFTLQEFTHRIRKILDKHNK